MPVIWFTISFTAGILSADGLAWDLSRWILISAILLFSWFTFHRFGKGRALGVPLRAKNLALASIIAFCWGALRYTLSLPDLEDPAYILNHRGGVGSRKVVGTVVADPDQREQIINLRLRCEYIYQAGEGKWEPVSGIILVKVPAETRVSYGDRVEVKGVLSLPPEEEGFNYRAYLRRKKIYVYLPRSELKVLDQGGGVLALRLIYSLRTRALDLLYELWPDPEASLLAGILLGVESGISDRVQKAFQETGTTHVIAISGFNITIVAGIFSRFFSRVFDRWKGAIAAGIGILIYTILVGADPAVTRAAVMGGLSIFARQIGRRQHGLNAAALASLIMFLVNPQLPWDISFQLSLSATLGLVLYADSLAGWFSRGSSRFLPRDLVDRITQPVSEYVLFTFAAQLTTLPVMLYHFKTFSLSAFIANPIILPVQPPIMVLGGLGIISALIYRPLGMFTAPLVYPFVLYTIRMVEWVSRLPVDPFYIGEIHLVWIWLYYGGLGLLTIENPLKKHLKPALAGSISYSGLAVAVILVWRMVFSAPDGRLEITFLDVGTGSGILIESPSGKRVLINGGPSARKLSEGLGRRLPPFSRDLDLLLVASPITQDLDALAAILPRFKPGQVIWFGGPGLCWEAEYLRGVIDDLGIPFQEGEVGQELVFQDGLTIRAVAESSRGGTLLIEYGSFRGLLPFGISDQGRERLRQGEDLGQVSVLLLADNGYQSSNPSNWISTLHPQLLLLSVGINHNQGLPDRGLLDRLAGYSLLRTDQNGSIHLATDGIRLWIELEGGP